MKDLPKIRLYLLKDQFTSSNPNCPHTRSKIFKGLVINSCIKLVKKPITTRKKKLIKIILAPMEEPSSPNAQLLANYLMRCSTISRCKPKKGHGVARLMLILYM